MWSKFALVAGALAVLLQGCIFAELPLPVKVAVGHQCDEVAGAKGDEIASGDEKGLKAIAAGQAGCGSSDAAKLEALGVSDCTEVLHNALQFILTTECENKEAELLLEDCKEVTEGCKTKLDSTLAEWVPESFPDEEQEAEDKEGFEATLAIIGACGKAAEDAVNAEKDALAELCQGEKESEFEIMGVASDKCPEYVATELTEFHGTMCAVAVLLSSPEDPEDVDKQWIDDNVAAYFETLKADTPESLDEELKKDDPAKRLRLFQTAVLGKKWAGRKSSLSKFAVFGGASLIALMALFAVGVRRRSKQEPVAEEQEMLESAE